MRFLPAATPTAERMQAVLAQVHKTIAPVAEGDDQGLDIDPALAACVQLALASHCTGSADGVLTNAPTYV